MPAFPRGHFCQPKIQNLGVAAFGYKNVGGLDVAMNYTFRVCGFERIGNFDAQVQGDGKDGVVYAMDARKIIPPLSMKTKKERLFSSIMTMRNPFVEYAVGLSFWSEPKTDHNSFVLPVRPDIVPGRIGQQSSCFTLHMHKAPAAKNDTLVTILVDASSKGKIRDELHRLNINQFTTYYDLDHLSKEIKRSWGLDK